MMKMKKGAKEVFAVFKDEDVHHPKHYTSHPSGIEAIVITEHMNFCLGNAVKYIFRAEHKGNFEKDIKKAIWYLERELKRVKALENKSKNP